MTGLEAARRMMQGIECHLDGEATEVTAESLGMTEERFLATTAMLLETGYITGVRTTNSGGKKNASLKEARLTLDGLNALYHNLIEEKQEKAVCDYVCGLTDWDEAKMKNDKPVSIKDFYTCQLCDELANREGVERIEVPPYESKWVRAEGPAIVFNVID